MGLGIIGPKIYGLGGREKGRGISGISICNWEYGYYEE